MKKSKVFFSMLAILFAVATAFAFNPKENLDDVYKAVPGHPTECTVDNTCSLTQEAQTCMYQPLSSSCESIDRWRPF